MHDRLFCHFWTKVWLNFQSGKIAWIYLCTCYRPNSSFRHPNRPVCLLPFNRNENQPTFILENNKNIGVDFIYNLKIERMNNLSKMKLLGLLPEKPQKATKIETPNVHEELIKHIVEMSHSEDYSHVFRTLTLALARNRK